MTSRAQLVTAVSNLPISDEKKETYYVFIGTQTEDQCATILLLPDLQNRVTRYSPPSAQTAPGSSSHISGPGNCWLFLPPGTFTNFGRCNLPNDYKTNIPFMVALAIFQKYLEFPEAEDIFIQQDRPNGEGPRKMQADDIPGSVKAHLMPAPQDKQERKEDRKRQNEDLKKKPKKERATEELEGEQPLHRPQEWTIKVEDNRNPPLMDVKTGHVIIPQWLWDRSKKADRKVAQLYSLYWFTLLIHEIGGHWKRWTYAQSDTPNEEEFFWNCTIDSGNRQPAVVTLLYHSTGSKDLTACTGSLYSSMRLESNGALRMDHFSPDYWNMHDEKISDPNAWTPTRKTKSYAQSDTPNEEEFFWNCTIDSGNRVELDVYQGYTINIENSGWDQFVAIREVDNHLQYWEIPQAFLDSVLFGNWSAGIKTLHIQPVRCIYRSITVLGKNKEFYELGNPEKADEIRLVNRSGTDHVQGVKY
ncbi:hypothetical protein PROFUN_12045 [Planoprotostelium fungivorum]|uniref:Uncharacterized protein n=1 Tax=Planoprotostelium fungivorum TaxID=1890364 RepID=A0A2P6MXM7_9EUKA|nr:hypothetical protein PROFUN_12045 [Planoprotostelium fungivorum]